MKTEKIEVEENDSNVPSKAKKKHTYYDKYLALQNEYLRIDDLQVIRELSYNKARLEMQKLVEEVKIYNQEHPTEKWDYTEGKPVRISKGFVVDHFSINESYIFKKAKEELQLKALLN